MKNRISLMLIMFIFSLTTFAQVEKQEMKHKGEEHKMHMKMMGDEDPVEFSDKMGMKLGLNAEQKEAVKKAQLKRKESLMELNKDHKKIMASEDAENMAKERSEMHAGMMEINEDFNESMMDVLDDSQYVQWNTMHTEQMKMHEEKMKMHDEKSKMKEGKMKMKMKTSKTKEKDDQDDDNPVR